MRIWVSTFKACYQRFMKSYKLFLCSTSQHVGRFSFGFLFILFFLALYRADLKKSVRCEQILGELEAKTSLVVVMVYATFDIHGSKRFYYRNITGFTCDNNCNIWLSRQKRNHFALSNNWSFILAVLWESICWCNVSVIYILFS